MAMNASRAERRLATEQALLATPYGRLSGRQLAEMLLPGVLVGLLGGLIAGGLTAAGGLPVDVALVSAVSLGLPLALFGGFYELLLVKGRMPLGPLAPTAILWAVGFPVARIINAAVTDTYAGTPVQAPHGWLDFLVFQVLLSVPFAIGFWWLHANFAPRWWFHLRERNPVADQFIRVQLQAVGERSEQQPKPAPARARSRKRRR